MRRKICVVTGSRAEYGLLYWLLKEIEDDPDLELQLVVTGAHLSKKYGLTGRVIEKDGFVINEKVDLGLGGDSPQEIAEAIGRAVSGLAVAYARLAPDVVTVLGDRYEILSAAMAALVMGVPLAHIHGGEITEGAMDDAIRHAVTKMAHLHFTTAEPYRQRVIQLGEAPERVFNVGAPGLDNIARLSLLDRKSLEQALGHGLGEAFLLVTYHPVTVMAQGAGVEPLLSALDEFSGHVVLFTGVNADPGREKIAHDIADYVAARPGRAFLHDFLGQQRYLSAMKHADAVVGNSSSGVIEAPSMGVPSVDIGRRQQGRLKAPTTISCGEARDEIAAAIYKAMDSGFLEAVRNAESPYGQPGASRRIKNILGEFSLEGILVKRFHDLKVA